MLSRYFVQNYLEQFIYLVRVFQWLIFLLAFFCFCNLGNKFLIIEVNK